MQEQVHCNVPLEIQGSDYHNDRLEESFEMFPMSVCDKRKTEDKNSCGIK